MKGLQAYLAAMVLGSSAVQAQAQDGHSFRASGPWAMEYADNACRLIRNFSNGDDEITLAFERFGPGAELRLGLAGDGVEIRRNREQVDFRYGPTGSPQSSRLYRTELADGRVSWLIPSASMLLSPPPVPSADPSTAMKVIALSPHDELDVAKGINSVRFTKGFRGELELNLGSMEAPIRAMQACIDDLLTQWGLDGDRLEAMSRPPAPTNSPGDWIKSEDYPGEMVARGRGGTLLVRLIIDEQGGVKRCYADIEKSGPFETVACQSIMRRARFLPALDQDGQPMPSYWSSTVVFTLH